MADYHLTEHELLPDGYSGRRPIAGYEFYKRDTDKKTAKNFGLKFSDDDAESPPNQEARIGPYVGVQRLPSNGGNGVIAHSSPKNFGDETANKTMDYAAMFEYCMGEPSVARHLDNCFFVWSDEPKIQTQTEFDFHLLVVLSFVNSLHDLCKRHLRRSTIRRSENLVGRVKGRILVSQQLRQNMAVNRPDRMVCNFLQHDINIKENQILRSALEVAAVYLRGRPEGSNNLQRMIGYCRTALDGVSHPRITSSDFLGIRDSGAFQHYKPAHGLAKAVLFSLGINPEDHAQAAEQKTIFPFVLCTFELFERFAEAVIRKTYPTSKLWVGYSHMNLKSAGYSVRPDMILIRNNGIPYIIDAKYKSIDDKDLQDAYKSVAYAHHFRVIETILFMLKNYQNKEILLENRKTLLLYPRLGKSHRRYATKTGFERLVKITIECPMK